MRKIMFLFCCLCCFGPVQQAAAQKKMSSFIGGNLIIGYPQGDFKDGYKLATGIDASLGFGKKHLYAIGTIGYVSYKAQSDNLYGKITLIPVKAGVRIYLGNFFFLSGNAGVGFLNDEVDKDRTSRFMYDVGAGFHFILGQVSVHYDAWQRKNNPGSSSTIQLKFGLALK